MLQQLFPVEFGIFEQNRIHVTLNGLNYWIYFSHWSITVELSTNQRLEYRYFVGKISRITDVDNTEDGLPESYVLVEAWEGGSIPRVLDLSGSYWIKLPTTINFLTLCVL
jgi:hypothetical protein